MLPALAKPLAKRVLVASACLALAMPAMAQPRRERAPGVPMAPKPAEIDRQMQIESDLPPPGPDTRFSPRRSAEVSPRADRDPPMPKGVPSIISP